MKKIYFLALAMLTVTVTSIAQNNVVSNISVDSKITIESIKSIMTTLTTDEMQGRNSGEEGYNKAVAYIEDIFTKNKIKPFFTTYKDTLVNFPSTTFNVVGVVPGNDAVLKNEYIIVGAHLDHIGKGKEVDGDEIANGANDNASGTTAVIELAKYFAKHKTNERSIIFALFAAEEKGLKGSKHLAKRLKDQNINMYTMVNFEMIGVPFTGRDYTVFATGYDKSNIAAKINEYAGSNLVGKSDVAVKYNLFMRSDNYAFYQEFKLPAHTISSCDLTNFDYYHHVDDELSEMDFEHMTTVINNFVPVLEKMSKTPAKEIRMYE